MPTSRVTDCVVNEGGIVSLTLTDTGADALLPEASVTVTVLVKVRPTSEQEKMLLEKPKLLTPQLSDDVEEKEVSLRRALPLESS
jgi:hypothetical protein